MPSTSFEKGKECVNKKSGLPQIRLRIRHGSLWSLVLLSLSLFVPQLDYKNLNNYDIHTKVTVAMIKMFGFVNS